jgi:hypothetical protein
MAAHRLARDRLYRAMVGATLALVTSAAAIFAAAYHFA